MFHVPVVSLTRHHPFLIQIESMRLHACRAITGVYPLNDQINR